MSTNRKFRIVSAIAILLAVALSPASALVVKLNGGDPGEGWLDDVYGYGYAPQNGNVYAFRFVAVDGKDPLPLQNVPFAAHNLFHQVDSRVTIQNAAAYPSAGPAFQGSPNDETLQDMGNLIIYGQNTTAAPYMTISLNGLVAGKTYQLDLFWFYYAGIEPLTYEITDAIGTVTETVPGIGGNYYNVRDTVVAGSGFYQVVIVAKKVPGGGDGPYINGLSVTEHVPEPTSALSLVSVGLLACTRRRTPRAA